MSKTIYDIFISYRRDGGGATAGRINDMLTVDGYSVSYDVDTLREGRFDMQLLERIEQCQDFILVVDKNCFVRTVDPTTNPQDDWLWQELKYALQLKKNVIPVLLAGAIFPQNLPEDIDNVRFCHGPKCVHEYFDSFYTKLKEMLRASPRLAKPSNVGQPLSTKNTACLKLKADIDCIFYLDGEERSHLKAGIIQKIPLVKGEYELMFVSEEKSKDRLELEFVMPDVDKLQKVNLSDARNARLQKEAEERKREAERKAEEDRKRREEEERAKERTFTVGGVSFKMIRVEGDSFQMGSPDNDSDAWYDEKPQHRVTLNDYYIGETQVTQALWKVVMGDNPSNWKGDNLPVERVSWEDCQKFIKQLNKKTGKAFRLPTEAEWEFAARGGKKSQGYKYSGSNNLGDEAWYTDNSDSKTHPVKGKKANELGLYDMSGNVWEWCQDWYGRYSGSAQANPSGPSSGSYRVLRGGSWDYCAWGCRVASRYYFSPDFRDYYIGFRLALSVVFILPPIPGYREDVVATSGYHGVLLWPGVFLFLLIVFMMFYPWLKLFVALALGKARTDYYGLFLSFSKSSKVVASVLTTISALSIIQLSVYAIGQAAVIRQWNYDYNHCPDLCIEITAFLLLSQE